MLRSLATIVVTPRKCSGPRPPGLAAEDLGQASDLDAGREPLRVDLLDRRGVDEVDAGRLGELRRRGRGRAGSRSRSSPAPNWAGLTNRLMTTTSQSLARRLEQRDVAGVQVAHRRHEADRPALAPRRRRARRGAPPGLDDPHRRSPVAAIARVRSASAR